VTDPAALLTLDQAAAFVPGADANTLKRLVRRGKLSVTRPGKAYLTTAADVMEAIRLCRVMPKVRDCGSVPLVPTAPPPLGSCSMEHANAALDSALAQASAKKKTR
jgi:hypothetical protein